MARLRPQSFASNYYIESLSEFRQLERLLPVIENSTVFGDLHKLQIIGDPVTGMTNSPFDDHHAFTAGFIVKMPFQLQGLDGLSYGWMQLVQFRYICRSWRRCFLYRLYHWHCQSGLGRLICFNNGVKRFGRL